MKSKEIFVLIRLNINTLHGELKFLETWTAFSRHFTPFRELAQMHLACGGLACAATFANLPHIFAYHWLNHGANIPAMIFVYKDYFDGRIRGMECIRRTSVEEMIARKMWNLAFVARKVGGSWYLVIPPKPIIPLGLLVRLNKGLLK